MLRTIDERTAIFSEHQLPPGPICKTCFSALAADVRHKRKLDEAYGDRHVEDI